MRNGDRPAMAAVLPYAIWMGLLFGLPATAECYAVRTALTAAAISVAVRYGADAFAPWWSAQRARGPILWGLGIGLLVCFLWIFPERFALYRDFSLLGALGLGGGGASDAASPYDPAVCGWPLTLVKLIGSAFVIAPVEELFFRSFLYRWLQNSDWTKVDLRRFDGSAFLWMVGLFALEHHTRLVAGAMAGAFYGWLAIRKGVGSAVIAHVTTNLLLGLYVILKGQWGFW